MRRRDSPEEGRKKDANSDLGINSSTSGPQDKTPKAWPRRFIFMTPGLRATTEVRTALISLIPKAEPTKPLSTMIWHRWLFSS